MAESADVLSPETVHGKFKEHGITHIVWLPDSETNFLFTLLEGDPDLHMVGVGREGNACAVASGLSAGGATPVILIQNTGMMESGDSIRGWLKSLKIPVVLVVGYRGYTRHGVTKDTAADFTEPFLNAFQLKYYLVESDQDADRISVAFEESKKINGPVVVLVADEFHGFNR
jgi:sulfopyruvate decarboxylase subunit alpha